MLLLSFHSFFTLVMSHLPYLDWGDSGAWAQQGCCLLPGLLPFGTAWFCHCDCQELSSLGQYEAKKENSGWDEERSQAVARGGCVLSREELFYALLNHLKLEMMIQFWVPLFRESIDKPKCVQRRATRVGKGPVSIPHEDQLCCLRVSEGLSLRRRISLILLGWKAEWGGPGGNCRGKFMLDIRAKIPITENWLKVELMPWQIGLLYSMSLSRE